MINPDILKDVIYIFDDLNKSGNSSSYLSFLRGLGDNIKIASGTQKVILDKLNELKTSTQDPVALSRIDLVITAISG